MEEGSSWRELLLEEERVAEALGMGVRPSTLHQDRKLPDHQIHRRGG